MSDIFNTQLDLLKAVTPNAGGASYLEVQIGGSSTIPVTGTVVAKIEDSAGNPITSTASALDVNLKSSSITLPVSLAGTSNVNVTNGAGASAVNIQDGGNSITIDGSVTVTQATGTNLHTVLDSGTLTSITNALPSGTNVIGHVITDTGSTTAVTGNVTVVQPTGTNLHTVLDSGTLTSITNALPSGTNVIGHIIADSGSTTAVTGNVTVIQPTGTSLHAVIDSGSTTAVTGNVTVVQPTGTNLHTVLDSGTLTSITNALPSGTNVIGHVIADSGSTTVVTGNVTVVQPTGTNLHVVTDSGTITTVSTVTNLSQMSGTAISMNNGTTDAGTQRVTLSSDSTGQVKLATGANTIGALTANQSVNVAQIAGNATLTGNGATGTGSQRVTIASDNSPISITSSLSATSTGMTRFRNTALSNTATSVKASSGNIYYYHVYNVNSADAFLQIYNVASGSVTVGTTTPDLTLSVPAGGVLDGSLDSSPYSFSTAITVAATTTITGGTAPSTGLLVALGYV